VPAYLPPLEDVRAAVERDWLQLQSEQAREKFFEALRERYDVRVETESQLAAATTTD
jgi:hypothetical protein